jgi:hypothetical protein
VGLGFYSFGVLCGRLVCKVRVQFMDGGTQGWNVGCVESISVPYSGTVVWDFGWGLGRCLG